MMNGYFMVIISMLIWGSIGVFVRYIDLDSELIVFYRVLIAGISILLIKGKVFIENRRDILGKEYFLLGVGGIFLSLNWLFFFKAIKVTTISSATLSYYTAPVLVTVMSIFILKEKIKIKEIFAVLLSFIGIIIMVSGPNMLSSEATSIGIGYGLTAAVFYGLVTITGKLLENVSSYSIVLIQTLVASLFFMPFINDFHVINIKNFILLLVVGLVHTSLALTLYFEGIKKIRVQSIGVLSYIDPLSAVLFAFIFFQEIPSIMTIVGGILILISTYIVINK
ncbi:EamA family transporter [Clostridium sp. D2Q-11]|uniref:EamA family transporter n=1 Tax=Anaeromonas frigoriresistens TaxID=2683708 RepID=A0A942US67_9FIRM|nr:DMT family transporter [Anaeromonas frigoriresistens]MBS4538259.1 EamA family transporter [Anaeromonas frigoriresistens]